MIQTLLRRYGSLPVVVPVTALASLLSAGLAAALDLVLKGQIQRFDLAIAGAIPVVLAPLFLTRFLRLIRQLDDLQESLRKTASLDVLTQAYNRGHFLLLAEREILRARRYHHPLTLLFLDLDFFKLINDQYGHAVGDQALRAAAETLHKCLRRTDVLGRFGGEEFMILLPETDPHGGQIVGERICRAFEEKRTQVGRIQIPLTVSVGVASLQGEAEEIDSLLLRADAFLYRAKNQGRSRVEMA